MKRVNILIVHFTYGWTQDFIESWQLHLPHEDIIVFNNNPLPGQIVEETRGSFGNNNYINKLCQKEINFLKSKKNIKQIVNLPNLKDLKIKKLLSHGGALDFIFRWCHEHDIDQAMLLEPDCIVKGTQWINDMICLLKNNWLVGSAEMRQNQENYVMPLCPTIWSVKDVVHLMQSQKLSFEKNTSKNRNTGQDIMKEISKNNMCKSVGVLKDFIHFNDGTRILHQKSCVKLF
jgi:hypothetical protein